jgi:predicted GH43/DUF377 family glycosyl hydrolase
MKCSHGYSNRPTKPFTYDQCRICWLAGRNDLLRNRLPDLPPVAVRVMPAPSLLDQPGGVAFNGSIIRHRGRTLMAYRTGWAGAEIHLCELGEGDRPGPSITLDLRHALSGYGREDPRLFLFRDRLHVSFIGFDGDWNGSMATNQLYARLRENFTVEAIYAPKIDGRPWGRWEKNWGFFECDGQLYAVYTIDPHVVLRIEGDRAELASQTPNPFEWSGGRMSGGAPPVLVGGEYWNWFHGVHELGSKWPTRQYTIGLYTFDAKPPFGIRHFAPNPIACGDEATRPADQYCSVIFPGGTTFDGETWRIACGIHDRWIEIRDYSHPQVLDRVRCPSGTSESEPTSFPARAG